MTGARASGQPVPALRGRWAGAVVALVLVAAALLAVAGPFPVTNGVARLAGWVLLTAGATVVVGRTGAVDLSTAAIVATGTYTGAVAVPLAGGAAPLGLAVGALAGAAVGAATGALAGRVGAVLAALPTLSVTVAVVAVLRSVPAWGGAAGHHAAPFLTGGEVGDAVALVGLAAVGIVVAGTWWDHPAAARASVGARAPAALAALGHHPAMATAVAGVVGGSLLGVGGAAQAFASGSASPSAFGLSLAAALALAAALGGAPPLGPVVGAAWLWGPAVLFPLAPVVGDAPPLLTTGLAGLALLAWRRGRPLVGDRDGTGPWDGGVPAEESDPAQPAGGATDPVLSVAAGPTHDGFEVRPGEVVAVVGPNGAGKSTLLARIGGQLPDDGRVVLHGVPAPRGPVARARLGLARTWQHAPEVPPADLLAAVGGGTDRGVPPNSGPRHETSAVAGAQVRAAVARRPDVLLLDEPATALDEEEVAALARALARAGIAVVLVDHRPAVLAEADRTCRVGGPVGGGP